MRNVEIDKKIENLAHTYLPEWRYDTNAPDSGTVLAQLVGEMLEDSASRFEKVVHKHKISYLNLFDKLKVEPIEAASSFVRFRPVVGRAEPIHIPQKTKLFAEEDSSNGQIVFETTHGITAVATELTSVYAADGEKDVICQLFPAHNSGGSDSERANFTAFDISKESLCKHQLALGFQHVLAQMESFNIGLRICTLEAESAAQAAQALLAQGTVFSIMDPEEGQVVIENVTVSDNIIWLTKEGYRPRPTLWEGVEQFVILFETKEVSSLAITAVELCFARSYVQPDIIMCGGIEQVGQKIKPFGAPMTIYAECGMESEEVFSKKGASLQMSFHLEFDLVEQKLPEYEEDSELKIIMKKPAQQAKVAPCDIYADYVLLEYLSQTGWKRLLSEEHLSFLFNTSTTGDINIGFDCPSDIVPIEQAYAGYRLRFRLMQAEHLYQIPCRQYCPVISSLRFSYDYTSKNITPSTAVLYNNFEKTVVTELFEKRRSVVLFTGEKEQGHSMYFGFTAPPIGTPFSMYFSLENRTDFPLDITMEYFGNQRFEQVKLVDGTGGLCYSGTLLLLIPKDCQQTTLFGRTCYWLRMVNHQKQRTCVEMPIISGVYLNMAKVQNHSTHTEYYYVNDIQAPFHIDVGEGNLIDVKVWVNEEGGLPQEDNWVLWQKKESYQALGRVYDVDMMAGYIDFARSAFLSYPVRNHAATVKVEYKNYRGSLANVQAGSIRSLSNAIPYIANVENPIPAFGGYDGYNEETSAMLISSLLRTRNRAVTPSDYMDIIGQSTYGVRRIKAMSDVDQNGFPSPDTITIALLIDQYEQGGYVFASIKERVREKLENSSCVLPLGKKLILAQPHFLPLSVRLWLECDNMENSYDLQNQTNASICRFLNPLDGGFEGQGWQIGEIPTSQQLLAFLGAHYPQLVVAHLAITVQYAGEEYTVDDLLREKLKDPFAMAVNGEHTIYIDLKTDF